MIFSALIDLKKITMIIPIIKGYLFLYQEYFPLYSFLSQIT